MTEAANGADEHVRPDADVVLLTRFNLPSRGPEQLVRAADDWLTNRWSLFERHCLPSVRAQTDRDHGWIVYLDPESPAWLKEHMAGLAGSHDLTPIYRESVSRDELVADVAAAVGECRRSLLITANLDNDDGLANDFVARLRAASASAAPAAASAVYFELGLIRTPTRLYLRHDPVNAFIAVREPWDQVVTCWVDWHNLVGEHMPVQVLADRPAWLQVVHGQNVSNRALGELVDPTPYRRGFPGNLDDLTAPSRAVLFADRYVVRPARAVREAIRAGVKGVAMRLVGKDGWTRMKHQWQSLKSRLR